MKKTIKIRRQQVKENVTEVCPWDLSGSPEDIYKELHQTQSNYLKDRDDIIEANWLWESAEYDGVDGRFVLTITRLENDKEYNARVKKLAKIVDGEKAAKEQEQKKEYEEYLRLKKKFEANPYRTNDWSSP